MFRSIAYKKHFSGWVSFGSILVCCLSHHCTTLSVTHDSWWSICSEEVSYLVTKLQTVVVYCCLESVEMIVNNSVSLLNWHLLSGGCWSRNGEKAISSGFTHLCFQTARSSRKEEVWVCGDSEFKDHSFVFLLTQVHSLSNLVNTESLTLCIFTLVS